MFAFRGLLAVWVRRTRTEELAMSSAVRVVATSCGRYANGLTIFSQRSSRFPCIEAMRRYDKGIVVANADDHPGVHPLAQRVVIRILAVDDFTNWRRQLHSLLQARPEWQVISEASDGLEAVEKAQGVKPDLILLDVGLPKLNGIEAARQIRQRSPSSKIIFLTQNNDLDVVGAALDAGAVGYVRKMDAGRELQPAIDAVLRGKRFVSSSFKDYEFTDTAILS
jgi:CheY-like chemotaxis protein